MKLSRSGGRCHRQRCRNRKVRRKASASPASSQPRFYAKQLGIDSVHHKHAFCWQTKITPRQNLFSLMLLKTKAGRAFQLIPSRFAFSALDRMSSRVFETHFLPPPPKRRLTIALLATYTSINKTTTLRINPIITYQNPKFPTRGIAANEENKASPAVSRRMLLVYLPRCSGHLTSQPQCNKSIYILHILHILNMYTYFLYIYINALGL